MKGFTMFFPRKLLLPTAVFFAAYCFNSSAIAKNELQKVSFALDWTPNTNHIGVYDSKQTGEYSKAGIDLSIIQPNQTTAMQLIAAGKVQFGVSFLSDLIRARAAGMPVVSVAAIIQHNTSCFAWRKESNIKTMKDWENKRYGGWGSPEEEQTLRFLMNKQGLKFEKIKIVTTGISDFLTSTPKNADFMWIYKGWDGIHAQLAGVQFDTLCLDTLDPAFDHPSPLIVTSEKMIKENPALVRKFLAATRLGYENAIKNPSIAAENLLKQVPELDSKLVNVSAKFLALEYAKGAPYWGWQNEQAFARKLKWVKDQKLIDVPMHAKSLLDNSFIDSKEK